MTRYSVTAEFEADPNDSYDQTLDILMARGLDDVELTEIPDLESEPVERRRKLAHE